jgi:hypothetical protein
MKKWCLALSVAASMFSQLLLAAPDLKPDHPESYEVQRGDTLWAIANRFLQDPWKWPEIWQANPKIDNPHLIYPGDILSLVYVDGKPRLVVSKKGPVKLSPKVRATTLDDAIPTIPLDDINAFWRNSRFVERDELIDAPYVLSGEEQHLIVGAGSKIYARGNVEDGGTSYGIYREGEAYVDEESGELLGIHMLGIGEVKLVSLEEDVATLEVLTSTGEVRTADMLLPARAEALSSVFDPSAPASEVEGKIMDVEKGVKNIGPMDIVMINLGSREGVEPGNVMAIYKLGESVPDPQTREMVKLPDVRSGLMMFFRVYEKMSFGLVLASSQALSVEDPVRMP